MGNDFLLSIAPLHEQQNDLLGLLLFSAITVRSTLNGQRAPPTAHYEQDSVTSTRNCMPELVSARLNSSKPSKSFCCSCRGSAHPSTPGTPQTAATLCAFPVHVGTGCDRTGDRPGEEYVCWQGRMWYHPHTPAFCSAVCESTHRLCALSVPKLLADLLSLC